jgi:predicted Fe-Mo cluster-binding NifX family protein
MKIIAIPLNKDNQIEDHFGKCSFYEVYSIIEDTKIVDVKTIASDQGCGCQSNIAQVLAENGVTIMLAGGIGKGAVNVLNQCNIEVIRGCTGDKKEIINSYLKGQILDNGISCSQHHQHKHQCNH